MQRICVDVGILLQSPLRRFNVEQIIGWLAISINHVSRQLALDDLVLELWRTVEQPEHKYSFHWKASYLGLEMKN